MLYEAPILDRRMIRCPVSALHRGQENYYGSTVNAMQATLVVQNPNPITMMKAFVTTQSSPRLTGRPLFHQWRMRQMARTS